MTSPAKRGRPATIRGVSFLEFFCGEVRSFGVVRVVREIGGGRGFGEISDLFPGIAPLISGGSLGDENPLFFPTAKGSGGDSEEFSRVLYGKQRRVFRQNFGH